MAQSPPADPQRIIPMLAYEDAGATIAAPPEDQFYGDRTYRAIDPEGARWIFATHLDDPDDLGDVAPEDIARATQAQH